MARVIKLLLLIAALSFCDGAKILGVFPVYSYSHYILANSLFEALEKQGHQVTMISAYQRTNSPNYTSIYLEGIEQHIKDVFQADAPSMENGEDLEKIPIIVMQWMMHPISLVVNDFIYTNPDVKELLDKGTFDVVIVEQIGGDAIKGLCYHFNAHCISFSSFPASYLTNYVVANPSPPSYVTDIVLPYSSKMTFFQRLHNLFFQTTNYFLNLYYLPKQNAQLHKYFPNAPHVEELIKNVSVVLLFSHIGTNHAVPHVPSMVEIGGLHIKDPKKLPKDLQDYLDSAKEGVVYFSLGSNVKSKTLSAAKREGILRALGKLNMKVLWKFEDDSLPNKPSNVKIAKWIPQQDVLAHPNLKIFITHGGLLSTMEAVHHGVPFIGIPFFGDQKSNMLESVKNGVALQILFKDLNEESLTNAINTILNDKSFYENMKKRSAIFRDNPVKPLDKAVYWVEYVIRHNGAHHLKTAAIDLPLYQYLLLDVMFVILLSILTPIVLVCKVVKYYKFKNEAPKLCSNAKESKSKRE